MASRTGAGDHPSLGRYELITQLGQGGMADVQLALQRGPAGFEKLVVVKLVNATLATQKTFVDMLLDEARLAALVKHPNVVDIYDLGHIDGRYFIAMEYLEGEPLTAVLRAGRDGERLDPLSTARVIADAAEGLDAAHELRSMAGDVIGLVHHDVSLGNIVVLYNGQVKLVDFGVAKATLSSTTATHIHGKFSYMAPEKLNGAAGDRRSDIWSLGCVLWEALTLRRLFKGGNDDGTRKLVLESLIDRPSTVNGDVVADFDPIVMRALERDPDKRYPTAKEMGDDLERVLRKQAYGARNDTISKYMQRTFEPRIVARKKLLQEVSSKGRASAAVLEAAFDDPQPPPSSTPELGILDNDTVMDGGVISDDPALDEASAARAAAARRHLRLAWLVGGALVTVILIALIVIVTRDPDAKAGAVAVILPDSQPAITVPIDAAEPIDPAIEVDVIDAGPVGPGPGSGSAVVRPPPNGSASVPKKPNVAELNRTGLQALVGGDYRTALATFKRAQAANPSHPPTLRGLAMSHEKLGQKAAAKAAYQRYLKLAPTAADAAMIRARMEQL